MNTPTTKRAAALTCGVMLFSVAIRGPAEAAADTAPADDGAPIGVTSNSPLPDVTSRANLSPQTVRPDTDTPNGFKLLHPGRRRSDYVYDSDDVYQGTYHCTDRACHLMAEVKVQLHQVAIGGSSHTWQLTLHMTEYQNAGHLTWSYFATYWCGVNIKRASDHECTDGAAPSHASMSHNTLVNKPWGRKNSITVFPMVEAATQFSNGVKVTNKFRGWDTLSRARTTKLNKSSDGG